MFSKGLIGYEENLALGMVTCLSGSYLIDRLDEAKEYADMKDYSELRSIYQLFERNIDKEKKALILSKFVRE